MSNSNPVLKLGEFNLPLKRTDFTDEKELTRFTKKCVSMIRQTIEYRDWVSYVKDSMGHKICLFTQESSDELTVEIHHHPLTLFDYVSIVLNTYMANALEFSSLDIMRDVLLLHFNDQVGYVPMVTTLHEKYHNGYLTIPPKYIQGVWDYIITCNNYIIPTDITDKVSELMNPANNKFSNYIWQSTPISIEEIE